MKQNFTHLLLPLKSKASCISLTFLKQNFTHLPLPLQSKILRIFHYLFKAKFYTSPFTYLVYLLTPWCRVLLQKLSGLQLVKKFPAFHGTRKFITALTSVRQLSLSWVSPIQSIYPHPTSWRSILILSTHLRLDLPSGLFPSSFPHQDPVHPLSSPIRATCPAHLILLDFIIRTILGEEYKSFSSSLCSPPLPLSNSVYAFPLHFQRKILRISCYLYKAKFYTSIFTFLKQTFTHLPLPL